MKSIAAPCVEAEGKLVVVIGEVDAVNFYTFCYDTVVVSDANEFGY